MLTFLSSSEIKRPGIIPIRVAAIMKLEHSKKPFSARIVPKKPKEVAKILQDISIRAVETASWQG